MHTYQHVHTHWCKHIHTYRQTHTDLYIQRQDHTCRDICTQIHIHMHGHSSYTQTHMYSNTQEHIHRLIDTDICTDLTSYICRHTIIHTETWTSAAVSLGNWTELFGIKGGSVVKTPPAMQETQVQSLGTHTHTHTYTSWLQFYWT